jgi:FkbM family methyltransferase
MLSVLSYVWTHPSNHGRRFRAIGRVAAWQIYKRMTGGYWDVKFVKNRKIRCYPNNTSASSVLYTGLFDYDEMHFLLRYLRPTDSFLDIGANVGVYTVLASSVVMSGQIHAFEPSSHSLLRLRENVEINGLANVLIHAVAVSDSPGNVYLTQKKDSMNHLVKSGEGQDVEVVTGVTLDEEVGDISFAMGKMDIEGAERMAMEGAMKMLKSQNPPVWLIEANSLSQRFGYEKEGTVQFLEKYGYVPAIYSVERNHLRLDTKGWRVRQNVILIAEQSWEMIKTRIASDHGFGSYV